MGRCRYRLLVCTVYYVVFSNVKLINAKMIKLGLEGKPPAEAHMAYLLWLTKRNPFLLSFGSANSSVGSDAVGLLAAAGTAQRASE